MKKTILAICVLGGLLAGLGAYFLASLAQI